VVNEKSIASYQQLLEEGTISKRQSQVLHALKEELGKATNRQLAKHLDWDINRVTGRISELRDKGLVIPSGSYFDVATNRTVNMWKCK
tara:strand:- start:176 stop:439 length:264 start_codon:yes stop_codon:yes gene_type:complete